MCIRDSIYIDIYIFGKSTKIYENSGKIELGGVLGPPGVPYWRPWASWEHLGSVLRASWSVLGASRWHPAARRGPHMDPRKGQKSSKIDPKPHWFFHRFLDAILIPKWSQNGSPNHPKTVQKSVSFFDRFLHRFLDRFWGPTSLKMSTSHTREAHFHKIAFSDSDIFWEGKWWKRLSKWNQNGLKNQSKNQKSF